VKLDKKGFVLTRGTDRSEGTPYATTVRAYSRSGTRAPIQSRELLPRLEKAQSLFPMCIATLPIIVMIFQRNWVPPLQSFGWLMLGAVSEISAGTEALSRIADRMLEW